MTREARRRLFHQVDIYPVTCEELSGGRSNLEVLEAVIQGGSKIIQLREKGYPKKDLSGFCSSSTIMWILLSVWRRTGSTWVRMICL
jgi:hypothetical protein